MTLALFGSKIVHSNKGQSLIELTLITPLMLLLTFGVVEVGSVISANLRLAQLTREGANLTSRGETPNNALDAIIAAATPTIRKNNSKQWKLIYSKIIQDPLIPCIPPQSCTYIIDRNNPPASPSQVIRGNLGQSSKIGGVGSQVTKVILPGIENLLPNQKLHAIEVFYDYGPDIITYVGRMINQLFYERTIFTDVSGKP
jgi:hypothetical protein